MLSNYEQYLRLDTLMTDAGNILISLESRHAEGILSGRKKVELRRRNMNVNVGSTVWFYVKLPVGSIVGSARIAACHSLAPSTLWRKFSRVSGLTRREFIGYFEGVPKGFAMSLEGATRLPISIPLAALRASHDGFHPPQFFTSLESDGALLGAIRQQLIQS